MFAPRFKTTVSCLLIGAGLLAGWWAEPRLFAELENDSNRKRSEGNTHPPKAAQKPLANDKALTATWEKDIKPMLEHYCYDCHGDGHHKGKLDMEKFSDLASMRANPKIWEHCFSFPFLRKYIQNFIGK